MKNNNDPMKSKQFKMGIVLFIILLLGGACLLRILYLSIFERPLYTGSSNKCLDKTVDGWQDQPLAEDPDCDCFVVSNNVMPVRGEIYDDQGRVLVSNVTVFDLTIDGRFFESSNPKYQITSTQSAQWIEQLSKAFYQHFKNRFPKYDLKYYQQKFTHALQNHKNTLVLQSNPNKEQLWITQRDTAFFNHLPLFSQKPYNRCINYTNRTVRINPYGDLAKRTLGMNSDGIAFGLEYCFNEQLAGKEGSRKYLYVNNTRLPLNESVEPVDGCDLHTTINLEIQNIVHNELKNKLIDQNAEWGCAIVMETKTGEIKAICNLRRANSEGTQYTESDEYVLHKMVEPGSTFKIASALAYLEQRKGNDDETYPILACTFERKNNNGKSVFYQKSDEPGETAGQRGYPIDVIQRSSNVGIASMVFDAFGIQNYKAYLQKIDQLYITTSFSTQLGKIQPPNIKRNAKDFHTYYNTCFGAGFTMTPIQTLIYYNAIANNGKMIGPLFVKYITKAHETEPIERFQAEVINEKICSQESIDKAKSYLEAVITGEHGTGRRFQSKTFTFAGKTGTRDIWDEELKAYNYSKNSVSFCGYFPADNPQFTCLVFMYNVSKKSSIAVEVFARIAENIMNTTNYAALQTVDTKNGKKLPRTNVVNAERYAFILESLGIDRPHNNISTPYITSGLNADYSVMVKASKFNATDQVPNVEGMIASDAVSELTRLGYEVKITGYGVVREQTLNKKNNTITLNLK